MKKKIFLALGIIALAGAAYGFYLFKKPHQSIMNEKPDYSMISSEIISEFETNEDAANKKFNGKVIEVTGVISEKTKDEQGKLNITLQGADIAGIGCVFEKAAQPKAAALAEGQEVKIKGVCTGILMDVVLVDCVVVENN
ncbi:MAG: OB-fold protein [Bacteroidota bacterium]